jgi:hypothetical protein
MGLPQNRLREMDQSRALPIHLPNWPSLTFSGVHVMSWLRRTMSSRKSVTRTNQLETAL